MNERKINWDELKGLSEEEIEKKAKEILSIMKVEEKVWQMVGDMPAILRVFLYQWQGVQRGI